MISNKYFSVRFCLSQVSTNLRFELNMNLITMGFSQNFLEEWKSIALRKRHRLHLLYHFNWLRVWSDFIIAICVNFLLI